MRGVNRVVTEHQLVWMLGRGTENESRRAVRLDDKRLAGLLERDKFADGHRLRCAYGPLGDCEPGHFMISRWLIGPAFTGRESNVQIVNALRRENRAFGTTVGA